MGYYIQYYNIKPGNEIIFRKSGLNINQHYARYLGYDEKGTDWIIHNNIGTGVNLVTADTFFNQCLPVNQIKRFVGTNYECRQLIERSLRRIGKPYSMINYSCEHFTSEIKTGKAVSKQLENALISLGLGIIFVAIFSD